MNVFISFGRWLGLIAPDRLPQEPVPTPAPPAAPPPEPPAPEPALVVRPPDRIFDPQTVAAKRLDVHRAVAQCNYVARSYGIDLWSPTHRNNIETDLLVMHLHDNLKRLSLFLRDASDAIVFEFCVDFATSESPRPVVDSARGIELPMLAPGTVASHLVSVTYNGLDKEVYRHLLKLGWTTSQPLQNRTTDKFEADHTGRTSGGRQRAFVSVAGARRRLTVKRVAGAGDYAFGYDTQLDTDVYLNLSSAPSGFRFYPGQIVTAVVVQTRRGAQGRNISAG